MSIEGLDRLYSHFPELESHDLILRQIDETDAAAIFAIFSDPKVTRYYDIHPLDNPEEAHAMVSRWAERFAERQSIRWGIELKSESGLVGTCGLRTITEWRGALGYDLRRSHWGQGIMSRALKLVLDFAFERAELNRVEALVIPGNTASESLLVRLGFEAEGILREYGFFKSSHYDLQMFSLLKAGYDPMDAISRSQAGER